MATELETPEDAVVDSTGSVFTDLGIPTNDEEMIKISIARAITNTIKKRNLTQTEAAEILGTDQAKVSAVLRGRLKGFTATRLIMFLVALGRDVDIHISRKWKNDKPGRVKILAA